VLQQAPISGEIEFRNLTFKYHPSEEPVLSGINLKIPAGYTVAFVGRTGSGKSTLTNLIHGLSKRERRRFSRWHFRADYPLEQLRASIGYVPQETFLSAIPCREYCFCVSKPQRAEIEWAAEIAGLTEDVRGFPQGFEDSGWRAGNHPFRRSKTTNGDRACCFARARILILDDALSRLTPTRGKRSSGSFAVSCATVPVLLFRIGSRRCATPI